MDQRDQMVGTRNREDGRERDSCADGELNLSILLARFTMPATLLGYVRRFTIAVSFGLATGHGRFRTGA